MRKADFEVKRTTRLWENLQCSEKEHTDARADLEAAQGRVEQAKCSAIAQKATVAALADDLARTEIRSPCDGYIVAKRTEIGSWVARGGAVVDLVDLSVARVRVPVPESAISFCRIGESVGVVIDALDGKMFKGHIARVIPDADERARTFPVEVDIPNETGELKAGMFARVVVPSGPEATQLVVPKDAVVSLGPMSVIYVVRATEAGQVAMPLPVMIVAEVLDQVAVAAQGLAPGDSVVVRGNENMMGQPTPVLAPPPAQEGSPQSETGATARPADVSKHSPGGPH
jgi:RND family efflux transporter MFP subunit